MTEFNAVHSTVVSRICRLRFFFCYHLSVIYFTVLSNFLVFDLEYFGRARVHSMYTARRSCAKAELVHAALINVL